MCVSHVTHVYESCHTRGSVMSHMRMCHVTHMYESCHTCVWVMSHWWISHVTHVYASCHKCVWVMSHMCVSHVTHVYESCHTCVWVMSHMCVSHVTRVYQSYREMGGMGRYPKKQKFAPCWKETKIKILVNISLRRPLHHYRYKIPLLHILKSIS